MCAADLPTNEGSVRVGACLTASLNNANIHAIPHSIQKIHLISGVNIQLEITANNTFAPTHIASNDDVNTSRTNTG